MNSKEIIYALNYITDAARQMVCDGAEWTDDNPLVIRVLSRYLISDVPPIRIQISSDLDEGMTVSFEGLVEYAHVGRIDRASNGDIHSIDLYAEDETTILETIDIEEFARVEGMGGPLNRILRVSFPPED